MWEQGLWTPEPLDLIVEAVAVPVACEWDPDQAFRLGTLSAEVWVWRADALARVSSPSTLRLAFPLGAAYPIFLDESLMALLAPEGVLLSQPAAAAGGWETTASEVP